MSGTDPTATRTQGPLSASRGVDGIAATGVDHIGAARPVRDGLFLDDPPRLLAGRCRQCGHLHFPRHDTCPYCASSHIDGVEVSGPARLWAWTAVTAAPPGYQGAVPFGFGVVELLEGVRVVTRLTEASPERLHAGQPMRLVLEPLHDDADGRQVLGYAFAPMDAP